MGNHVIYDEANQDTYKQFIKFFLTHFVQNYNPLSKRHIDLLDLGVSLTVRELVIDTLETIGDDMLPEIYNQDGMKKITYFLIGSGMFHMNQHVLDNPNWSQKHLASINDYLILMYWFNDADLESLKYAISNYDLKMNIESEYTTSLVGIFRHILRYDISVKDDMMSDKQIEFIKFLNHSNIDNKIHKSFVSDGESDEIFTYDSIIDYLLNNEIENW